MLIGQRAQQCLRHLGGGFNRKELQVLPSKDLQMDALLGPHDVNKKMPGGRPLAGGELASTCSSNSNATVIWCH